jgi:hypothetical protein
MCYASQQNRPLDVRLGSKADKVASICDVCFAPESGL